MNTEYSLFKYDMPEQQRLSRYNPYLLEQRATFASLAATHNPGAVLGIATDILYSWGIAFPDPAQPQGRPVYGFDDPARSSIHNVTQLQAHAPRVQDGTIEMRVNVATPADLC